MESKHSSQDNKEDPVVHHPEFVILDGDEEIGSQKESISGQREYFDALHRLGSQRYHFLIRILLFVMSLGVACVALFFLLATGITAFFAGLTLFRSADLNANLNKTWRGCKKLTVIALGSFVAAFSPTFGLGLILLYFVMHGENINQGVMGRVFRGRG